MTKLSPQQVQKRIQAERDRIAKIMRENPGQIKVYIPAELSAADMGESFWAKKVGKDEAIVDNICLCGLGVGDRIRFRNGAPDDHAHIFVEVVKKAVNVTWLSYDAALAIKDGKFTPEVVAFRKELEKKEIDFEGITPGMFAVQFPLKMTEDQLQKELEGSPIKLSKIK